MTSDDSTRPGRQSFAQAGPGSSVTFKCARCLVPKRTPGRRKLPVSGIKQWVCAACAAQFRV